MALTTEIDGTEIASVRRGEVELRQCAELGTVGGGQVVIDDADGDIEIVGQKDIALDEDDCADPVAFRGFVADREYERNRERVAASREITVNLEDLNAMLGFRGILDGKRPAETVATRGAWLLAHDSLDGLVVDNGRCEFPSDVDVDKADYRKQFPGDVLADMALAVGGINYYVREFDPYVGPELVFRDDNASTDDSSTIRISNVAADVTGDLTGMTFYPSKDFRLTRSPGRVKSKITLEHAKGNVTEERTATATSFNGERYGVASNANIKTDAQASSEANTMLWQLHTEEDVLEGKILVPSTHANLVNHGDRLQAKFSHLATEGYGSFTWFRVLECNRKPLTKTVPKYELALRLSPQEAADIPGDCVDLYPGTPSDTYYALGGQNSGPDQGPNVSDGVIFYWRAGCQYPSAGQAGLQGDWHAGLWSVGGAGVSDYAGDCAQNRLVIVLIGNGTAEIQTSAYPSGARGLVVRQNSVVIQTGASGDTFTVDIDDRTDGNCVSIIEITDNGLVCGGKWGFTQMDWTAA